MMSGESPDATQAQDKTKLVDPMVGKTLDGRYQIVRLIGTGGMGAVYLANNMVLQRQVAVKIMHPQLLIDERTVGRFRQEVKAMSSLSHPNLIQIVDVGQTEFGSPYFVMEYLASISLSELLQKEVFLEPERAKPIVLQIADALSHAHAKNIIHRDLKPPNILIIESETRDFVKVVDLGVAKLLGGNDDATSVMKLTQTGEVFGSPMYMAPEQVLGRPHDNRTDIYQLGCVMYEMLVGVPPLVRQSAILTMNAHIEDIPKPFLEVMPELPQSEELEWLESVVLRCLEKDPADRFQNMKELMRAVDHGIAPTIPPGRISGERPSVIQRAELPVRDDDDDHVRKDVPRKVSSADDNRKTIVIIAIACGAMFLLVVICMMIFIFALANRNPPGTGAGTPVSAPGVTKSDWRLYEVAYPPVAGDPGDLRVLSVYNGQPDSNSPATEEIDGNVEVFVKAEGKPLILVLNSYMPTTWTIKKANSRVKIKKIITVGYFPQKVKGAPGVGRTNVYYSHFNPDGSQSKTGATHKNLFEPFYFIFTPDQDIASDSSFATMKAATEKATGCHLRSFKGIRQTDRFSIY